MPPFQGFKTQYEYFIDLSLMAMVENYAERNQETTLNS
jgi:hypothetical protein